MAPMTKLPANGFVATVRKVYNPLGYYKGYNFVLFVIFAGALMGFCLARINYLDYHGVFCAPGPDGAAIPGECHVYMDKLVYQVGIRLHLITILPGGILACFQFVPVIRHKLILLHRINGYVVILLALAANAGALMIARHAVGGGLETQAVIGLLAILTTGSLALAYYNIKRLQIDQHRAWMLRAWFYFGTIITTRLIMFASSDVITASNNYYQGRPCAQILSLGNPKKMLEFYPECAPAFTGSNPQQWALVHAKYDDKRPERIGAGYGMVFGMSLWVALAIHAIGVELYLQLTPKEANRLRQVSYQRQLEAGFDNPGNAGLTVQRIGDADPFVPEQQSNDEK